VFLAAIIRTPYIRCGESDIVEQITRKTLLYKTGVEYGDYTINHVLGCSHGCRYPCYAMLMAKRFGNIKSYEDWCRPRIVANAEELLTRELPRFKDRIKSVHLCFTTDPFMYGYPQICDLSVRLIRILNDSNIKCTALTKGILPEELTFLSKENEYGITLISLNEEFRKKIEPGASPYSRRLESLRRLHNLGFKTWVSVEPYPTPNIIDQDFSEILNEVRFVDKIIFGRLNYNSEVTKYKDHKMFFNKLARQTADFCLSNNIECHIKKGTITDGIE
jgi:DNA repair photolyase